MSLIEELKRRKVFRVAASYAVVAFIIFQLVEILFPIFNFPQWTQQFVVIIIILGFPIALIFSWVFDKTPEGFIKTDAVKSKEKKKNEISKNTPFLNDKRNWMLIGGIVGGILIGWFGQSTTEVIEPINEKSIAVLPFENLSQNEDDEYFADGMTEDLLTELSKIKDLLVISRTTIMKYKNSSKSLKEIGKELGVANILEGSIRRIGDRVRITGQLIKASSDQNLWAEKYDRDIQDIFSVQDEVANAIANALRIELSDEESMMISSSQTESVEAYDLYIKGRQLSYSYQNTMRDEVINLYREAIKIDPNYALPYAGISRVRMSQRSMQGMDLDFSKMAVEEAEQAAKKAVQLGPNEAETHFALGFFYNQTEEYEKAYSSFNTAIMLNPSHAHAHDEIGDVYLYKYGDFDKAIIWYDKALKRDPELVPAKWFKSEVLLRAGRAKEGLELLDQALSQNPNVAQFSNLKHSGLTMIGKHQEAYDFIIDKKDLYTTESSIFQYYQALGLSLLNLDRSEELNKLIKEIENTSNSNFTHQGRYLSLLLDYKNENYQKVIKGFESLDNANLYSINSDVRRIMSDVFYYWRAKSFIALGDYQSALKETFRFRAANNHVSGQTIFDAFWPKKSYLKGLAYEGLGDRVNAIESFEDFLRIWSNADEDLPEIVDTKKRLRNLGRFN